MLNSVRFSPMQKPLQVRQKTVKFGQNDELDKFMKIPDIDVEDDNEVKNYYETAKNFLSTTNDIKKREEIANKASRTFLDSIFPSTNIHTQRIVTLNALGIQRKRAELAEEELSTLKELNRNQVLRHQRIKLPDLDEK